MKHMKPVPVKAIQKLLNYINGRCDDLSIPAVYVSYRVGISFQDELQLTLLYGFEGPQYEIRGPSVASLRKQFDADMTARKPHGQRDKRRDKQLPIK